jgi:hypothetical protein
MLLQSAALCERGYEGTSEWGWQYSLLAAIRREPDDRIIPKLARQIKASLADPYVASSLVERISEYLAKEMGRPLNLNVRKELPTAQEAVELVLSTVTNAAAFR